MKKHIIPLERAIALVLEAEASMKREGLIWNSVAFDAAELKALATALRPSPSTTERKKTS